MAMSAEHKAALVQGRREAKAIKAYLEALASRRPGRPVTRDSLQARLTSIDERLANEGDVLKRVDLIQSRLEAEKALAFASTNVDMNGLEKGFVEMAGEYSERKGISYGAWRAAGVPANILKAAGIARTRRG
jgi:hypothetical protein